MTLLIAVAASLVAAACSPAGPAQGPPATAAPVTTAPTTAPPTTIPEPYALDPDDLRAADVFSRAGVDGYRFRYRLDDGESTASYEAQLTADGRSNHYVRAPDRTEEVFGDGDRSWQRVDEGWWPLSFPAIDILTLAGQRSTGRLEFLAFYASASRPIGVETSGDVTTTRFQILEDEAPPVLDAPGREGRISGEFWVDHRGFLAGYELVVTWTDHTGRARTQTEHFEVYDLGADIRINDPRRPFPEA